jgi:hypothetical protein
MEPLPIQARLDLQLLVPESPERISVYEASQRYQWSQYGSSLLVAREFVSAVENE